MYSWNQANYRQIKINFRAECFVLETNLNRNDGESSCKGRYIIYTLMWMDSVLRKSPSEPSWLNGHGNNVKAAVNVKESHPVWRRVNRKTKEQNNFAKSHSSFQENWKIMDSPYTSESPPEGMQNKWASCFPLLQLTESTLKYTSKMVFFIKCSDVCVWWGWWQTIVGPLLRTRAKEQPVVRVTTNQGINGRNLRRLSLERLSEFLARNTNHGRQNHFSV